MTNLTVKDINNKIDILETRKFMLEMKDNWNAKDFEEAKRLDREIVKLEKMLEEV